jgi:phage shock protein PspC (stress-responsive transcriptional regulator)
LTINELVGFGGVFLLGLIGFIVSWVLMPRKEEKLKK